VVQLTMRNRLLSLGVRLIALLASLAFLLVLFAVLATEASISGWLFFVAGLAFIVVNARCLFPWPVHRSDLAPGCVFARLSSWLAVVSGTVLTVISVVAVGVADGLRLPGLLLAITGALNLVALREPRAGRHLPPTDSTPRGSAE